MKKSNAIKYAENLMQRYPKAEDYPYESWSYTQGFYLWGMVLLYEKTKQEKLLTYIREYGDMHVDEAGRINGFNGENLDNIMPASVIVWLYGVFKEEKYRLAADCVRKVFDTYPRNSDGGFWHSKTMPGEMWVDGLFMGLMFLTRYGHDIGDTQYCYEETLRQLHIVFERCQKDKTGFLYHGYGEQPTKPWVSRINGCSPEIWCEGLGWYAMILSDVLTLIPSSFPGYDPVAKQMKLLCRDLVKAQDLGCGLWYQVVDRPRFSKNFHDTSGSAMFLYSLKKALDFSLIEGEEYSIAIQKAYRGVLDKIYTGIDGGYHVLDACNGLGVQNNYDAYVNFPKSVDAREAVAAVLWALCAVEEGTVCL